MRIDLLFAPGCPNRERARQRLRHALDAVAVEASVSETEVATPEAAARVGMRGSPTVLVEGRDPFPTEVGEIHGTLSCRLYRTGDTFDGAPTVEQLIDALIHADRRG